MNLLLDTHAFIWFDEQPDKLSQPAIDALMNENNQLYLSIASVWEMQIKIQLEKLQLKGPLKRLVDSHRKVNGLKLLPISVDDVYQQGLLPFHHKDPFDRIIISQAINHQMPLVTKDCKINAYQPEVTLLWD
tara:strand:+ start:750 stop:1145 length:396 start_codon:yes stop_codon:yes gene_type:complete